MESGASLEQLSVDTLMRVAFGFQASRVVAAALELQIFTRLAGAGKTLPALVEELHIAAEPTRDVVDALVAMGFLQRGDEGVICNSEVAGTFLVSSSSSYIGEFLRVTGERHYANFGKLAALLRTGQPQSPESQGAASIFDTFTRNPEQFRDWLRQMSGMAQLWGKQAASLLPLSSCKTFVDIGGAEGAFSAIIAQTNAQIEGMVLDFPAVEPIFTDYVRQLGLEKRLRFQAGDYKKDPIPSVDLVTCAHVLHSETPQSRLTLLRAAHHALNPGGFVAVIDFMVDDDRRDVPALLASLAMRLETRDGFESNVGSLVGWLHESGFELVLSERLNSGQTLVVGKKR